MKPTYRSFDEIRKSARESFFKANGYYPTVEDAIRLTEEARDEIEKERSEKKGQEQNENKSLRSD